MANTRQFYGNQRRQLLGSAGHREVGNEVDVKAGELGRAEEGNDGDPQGVRALRHPLRGPKREAKVVTEVNRGRLRSARSASVRLPSRR